MATRTDVDVDFIPSPRVATVQSPSVQFNAQDVVDTLRIQEESWRGQTETKLLDASGKENLGGGIQVGITTSLQDTQIAFESRTTPAQTGTATTASGIPVGNIIDLYDTAALFQTNGVARGSLVINFTDNSIAEVYSVVNETHLKTRTLVNGTDNSFDIGDSYQVFNIIQCEISGGNVVAVDDLGSDISPVLPTAFTQVVRTSSSSATLSNQEALEYSTFNGAIHIDVINGVSGTDGLKGNESNPVNNLTDAKSIAQTRGFDVLDVTKSLTVGAAETVSGYTITGNGPDITTLVFVAGSTSEGVTYKELHITGDLNGAGFLLNCHIESLTGIGSNITDSSITNCLFKTAGTLQLNANNSKNLNIRNTISGVAGTSTPILDVNNSTGNITIHHYQGGLKIINNTGSNNITFDSTGGRIELDATCTSGTIVIRGNTKIADNSGPGFTIIDQTTQTNVWDHSADNVVVGSHGEIARKTAFSNTIRVDVNNGASGTAFPLGTAAAPVNNMADAVSIGLNEGIYDIMVAEDVTILSTDNVDNFTISGSHANKSQITIQPGASTNFSQFYNCFLVGTLNGRIIVRDSVVEDLLEFEGILHQVVINGGGITLRNAVNAVSYILDCYSGVPGSNIPEVNFNNGSHGLVIRAYSGGIKLTNKNSVDSVSVDFISGHLFLDGTITAGEIVIRGIYQLTDNSIGATITQNTNLDVIEFKIDNVQTDVTAIQVTLSNVSLVIDDLLKYQSNKSIIDPIAYTLTIYENDGTTPLKVFDLKDSSGIASFTSIFQRIPR